MYHSLRMILYHGTASEIQRVDVKLGRERKDFGKSQAIGMMHKKFREVVRRSKGKQDSAYLERLYEITLNKDCMSKLNIKVFHTADLEWLDFVLMCREKGGMPHAYDMVAGPTADDDTVFCLKAYGMVYTARSARMLLRGYCSIIWKQRILEYSII